MTILAASLLFASVVFSPPPPIDPDCRPMVVTGYVRSEFGPLTYDETPILTPEPIAAASWDIPMGSKVEVKDVGTFRVADRGMLGSLGWIDIAVHSREEAYALTGSYHVCVYPPEVSITSDAGETP